MAHVFKRTYQTTNPKTGKRVHRKTSKYYGTYTDELGIRRRVPLCTDKAASEQMLHELRTKAEQHRHGLADPSEGSHEMPLAGQAIHKMAGCGSTD